MAEKSLLVEAGITLEEGREYRVERPFYFRTDLLGPLTLVKADQRVFLSMRFGRDMFVAGKVSPVELGEVFEVLRPFQAEKDGEWVELHRGDIIRLSRDEAIPLLREQKIREKKGVKNETENP